MTKDNNLVYKNQRVGVFIDAQNIYHSATRQFSANVNLKNVVQKVNNNRTLINAMAYVITTPEKDESSFVDAIKNSGINVRDKDIKTFYTGAKKADWDIGIAMDIIRFAPKLDTIILVSGDGDFFELIEYVKNSFGCNFEVASFQKSTSAKLIEIADEYTDLSKVRSIFMRKNVKK